jgi:hypothetical protein
MYRVGQRLGVPREHQLFTRMDLHYATDRYRKPVHCDRPNRLCSFIVYFNDAEDIGLEGGELTLHRHRRVKPLHRYERYPRDEDTELVRTLVPQQNLVVYFVGANNSYHAVNEVRRCQRGRNYAYISVSTMAPTGWY